MEQVLEELCRVGGIEGCIIVGKDGLVITQSGKVLPELDFLGASMADLFTNLESLLGEKFAQGDLDMVTLEAKKGKIFLRTINEVTFLVVFAQTKVNLGLLRGEIRIACERLKDLL